MAYWGSISKIDVEKNERRFVRFLIVASTLTFFGMGIFWYFFNVLNWDVLAWCLNLASASHRFFFDVQRNSNPKSLPNQNNLFNPVIFRIEKIVDFFGFCSLVVLFISFLYQKF